MMKITKQTCRFLRFQCSMSQKIVDHVPKPTALIHTILLLHIIRHSGTPTHSNGKRLVYTMCTPRKCVHIGVLNAVEKVRQSRKVPSTKPFIRLMVKVLVNKSRLHPVDGANSQSLKLRLVKNGQALPFVTRIESEVCDIQ